MMVSRIQELSVKGFQSQIQGLAMASRDSLESEAPAAWRAKTAASPAATNGGRRESQVAYWRYSSVIGGAGALKE